MEKEKDLTQSITETKAIVIAETFTKHLHPLNESINELLIPVASVPYIEYLVDYLITSGIQQIIIVCKSHHATLSEYVKTNFKSILKKNPKKIQIIHNENLSSVGDCLREVNKECQIENDFILFRGLTITNFNLEKALKAHFENQAKDKHCTMLSIFKTFKNSYSNETTNDDNILIFNQSTNQILQYQQKEGLKKIPLNNNITFKLKANEVKNYEVRTDVFDTFIDICVREVLTYFSENFDYKEIRDDLYKNFLVSDMYMDTFYYYELEGLDYCNTIKNMDSYLKITSELINRWAYPITLDSVSISQKLDINYICSSNNVYLGTGKTTGLVGSKVNLNLSRIGSISDFRVNNTSANYEETIQVSADYTSCIKSSVIGANSVIKEDTLVINSVIGKRCVIGKGSKIKNSIISDDCDIGEYVEIINSVICSNVFIRSGTEKIISCYIGTGVDIFTDNKKLKFLSELEDKRNGTDTAKGIYSRARISVDTENTYQAIGKRIMEINENENNIIDSDEENDNEKSAEDFIPYNIVTHEDFYKNMDELDMLMNNIPKKEQISNVNQDESAEIKDENNEENENEKSNFTETDESANDDQEEGDFEQAIIDIFEKVINSSNSENSSKILSEGINELNMLRKVYWDNTSGEYDEYDHDFNYHQLKNAILKWEKLLKNVMTEESDKLVILFVVERIVQVRSVLEGVFSDILTILLNENIIDKNTIITWRQTPLEECGYKSYIEGFTQVSESTHNKLIVMEIHSID